MRLATLRREKGRGLIYYFPPRSLAVESREVPPWIIQQPKDIGKKFFLSFSSAFFCTLGFCPQVYHTFSQGGCCHGGKGESCLSCTPFLKVRKILPPTPSHHSPPQRLYFSLTNVLTFHNDALFPILIFRLPCLNNLYFESV